jgi:hypothetical protein
MQQYSDVNAGCTCCTASAPVGELQAVGIVEDSETIRDDMISSSCLSWGPRVHCCCTGQLLLGALSAGITLCRYRMEAPTCRVPRNRAFPPMMGGEPLGKAVDCSLQLRFGTQHHSNRHGHASTCRCASQQTQFQCQYIMMLMR